ncbi:unnamed protein product [Phaeothamnion confervicola]
MRQKRPPRESKNPFYVTSSELSTTTTERRFNAPTVYKPSPRNDLGAGIDWSFMYTKESEQFGIGVPQSDSKLSAAIALQSSFAATARRRHCTRREPGACANDAQRGVAGAGDSSSSSSENGGGGGEMRRQLPSDQASLDKLLERFDHRPRRENPLYTTTANEIGLRKPTGATFTFERSARQQGFSNSFNNVRYRDMGLSTSLTRSNVHKELDPQFL